MESTKRTDIPKLSQQGIAPLALDPKHTLMGYALHHKHKTVMWVDVSNASARESFDKAKRLMKQSFSGSLSGFAQSKQEIYLTNGTKIFFRALGDGQQLRGFTADYVGFNSNLLINHENAVNEVFVPMVVNAEQHYVASGFSPISTLDEVHGF